MLICLNIDSFLQAVLAYFILQPLRDENDSKEDIEYDISALILMTPEGLLGGSQWITTLLSSFVSFHKSQRFIWCFLWDFFVRLLVKEKRQGS